MKRIGFIALIASSMMAAAACAEHRRGGSMYPHGWGGYQNPIYNYGFYPRPEAGGIYNPYEGQFGLGLRGIYPGYGVGYGAAALDQTMPYGGMPMGSGS
ncbi:MAG TPA: hypothetical protein VG713_13675 [Pirellulales bacterium]|nr:hypothetical protein [Pirellulales bacterium]